MLFIFLSEPLVVLVELDSSFMSGLVGEVVPVCFPLSPALVEVLLMVAVSDSSIPSPFLAQSFSHVVVNLLLLPVITNWSMPESLLRSILSSNKAPPTLHSMSKSNGTGSKFPMLPWT
jgi:hypothetical protein